MATEGGEGTRLRCLSIARCMAAAVVAALAAVVVLLVLTTGLRTEYVSLSVTHGHIQAAQVLWTKSEFVLPHYWRHRNQSLMMYEAASSVDFWVSMNVHQPSGGGGANKTCNITTVRVLDMPNAPSFLGMVEIARIPIHKEICKDRHHRALDTWVTISNQSTLDYIAKTYGGMNEFTAMLQVNIALINNATQEIEATTSHYCWPVTIGHSRSTTAEAVTCKQGHHIDYAADSGFLAPPPPPPPPPPTTEISW